MTISLPLHKDGSMVFRAPLIPQRTTTPDAICKIASGVFPSGDAPTVPGSLDLQNFLDKAQKA